MKSYCRERNARWTENNCTEGNMHVVIGDQNYFLFSYSDTQRPCRFMPPRWPVPDLAGLRRLRRVRQWRGRLFGRATACHVRLPGP
jgi:hypothetical protein